MTYAKQKRRLKVIAQVANLYAEVDALNERMRETPDGQRISCQRGCNACCRMSTMISATEALFIVARYPALVKERLAALTEQARLVEQICAKYDDRTLENERAIADDWWELQIPCAFLLANGDCGVYNARPIPCRTHFVADDPALCAKVPPVHIDHAVPAHRDEAIKIVQHIWLNAQQGSVVTLPIGSLPKMVLLAHQSVVKL